MENPSPIMEAIVTAFVIWLVIATVLVFLFCLFVNRQIKSDAKLKKRVATWFHPHCRCEVKPLTEEELKAKAEQDKQIRETISRILNY
jgi:uncharacterized protein HemY